MVQSPIYPHVVRKNLRVVYIFLSFYCNLAYLFLWLSVVISTCEMLLSVREVRLNIPGEMFYQRKSSRARRSLRKSKRFSASISQRELSKSRRWSEEVHPEILPIKEKSLSALPSEEVIGIITMEDVIEELLKVKKMFPLVSTFLFLFLSHLKLVLISWCRRRSMMRQIILMSISCRDARGNVLMKPQIRHCSCHLNNLMEQVIWKWIDLHKVIYSSSMQHVNP